MGKGATHLKAPSLPTGVVLAVRGSLVDIRFETRLPPIYSVQHAGEQDRVVIEVLAQRDSRHVRGIALTPTQGLARDMVVKDTGGPLKVPVGKQDPNQFLSTQCGDCIAYAGPRRLLRNREPGLSGFNNRRHRPVLRRLLFEVGAVIAQHLGRLAGRPRRRRAPLGRLIEYRQQSLRALRHADDIADVIQGEWGANSKHRQFQFVGELPEFERLMQSPEPR